MPVRRRFISTTVGGERFDRYVNSGGGTYADVLAILLARRSLAVRLV